MVNKENEMPTEPNKQTGASSGAGIEARKPSKETGKQLPIWHKNHTEFWLAVCIAISIVFGLIYTAVH